MLGERIKHARQAKGLTQKELADATEILTQAALSKIEKGTVEPARKSLVALARVLGDDFGLSWLTEKLDQREEVLSKKDLAESMSAREFLSLKFGGKTSKRSRAEAEMLAKLLDAEIKRIESEGW